jgi:hypothetical protein
VLTAQKHLSKYQEILLLQQRHSHIRENLTTTFLLFLTLLNRF